eukprot:m.116489 g.116489  ORF g.116489 m.116489 type:complete len:470 (-) comp15520_c0_seq2:95-1504(-)
MAAKRTATPRLIADLSGHHVGPVNDAYYVESAKAIVSVSDDKNIIVWLRRDDGTYWPSISHAMPAAVSALCLHEPTHRLFVGLEQGNISEYEISEDYNILTVKKNYIAHTSRVRCIIYDHERQRLLSCGNDKCVTLLDAKDGRRLSAHSRNAWCTSLQYDDETQNVFVGDFQGKIGVLKIANNKFQFISELEGHSGSVRTLLWVPERGYLFSGSFDKTVMCWDIGGGEGTAYELSGHRNKVRGLAYVLEKDVLLSTSDDGMLVCWDMKAERKPTPEWGEGDCCQLCTAPFFWNVKAMWQRKSLSFKRQHHCRRCGKVTCDKCSTHRVAYPVMGFEFGVRLCDTCFKEVEPESKVSLARHFPLRHEMLGLRYHPSCNVAVLWARDGTIKLLDPSPVLDMAASYLNTTDAHAQAKADPDEDPGSEVVSPAPGGVDPEVVDLSAQPREDDEEDNADFLKGLVDAEDDHSFHS